MNDRLSCGVMKQKPIVLVPAEVYLPGYLAGGPVRSIAAIVSELADDFHWKIITTNRDLRTPVPYPGVAADTWTRVGDADVWYASKGRDRAGDIVRLIRDTPHDLLYLNSFFSPRFSIAPALARKLGVVPRRPLLIAPRGEFSPGALGIKGAKKRAYLTLARALDVYRDCRWHASADADKRHIERVLPRAAGLVSVAADSAPTRPAVARVPRQPGEPLRVCFLSRISPMKNLDFALRALALTKQPLQFAIHGPKEDGAYWNRCAALVASLPPHVQVRDAGAVPSDDVPRTLASYDLFFLPTRGENFGHVIVEAWNAGLPVLTSDQTPWRDLEAKGMGWDLPLGEDTLATFAARIDEFASTPAQAAEQVHQRIAIAARSFTDNPMHAQDKRDVFLSAINGHAHGKA